MSQFFCQYAMFISCFNTIHYSLMHTRITLLLHNNSYFMVLCNAILHNFLSMILYNIYHGREYFWNILITINISFFYTLKTIFLTNFKNLFTQTLKHFVASFFILSTNTYFLIKVDIFQTDVLYILCFILYFCLITHAKA